MMQLDFLVARRGLDPAAETCEHALRDLLGIDLAGLERGELWRFDVGALVGSQVAPLRERLREAACRAGRYVNLNRDVCTWLDAPRDYPAAAPPGGSAVDVWVRDGDGVDARALGYFRARAHSGLLQVWRGILWRLWLPGTDPAVARRRALEIAVACDRRQGLLANPHAQSAEILGVVRGPAVKETT